MNGAHSHWQRLKTLFQVFELPSGGMPVRLAIAMAADELTSLTGFPQAALPASGRVASGRGMTAETCAASALGEAAELVSCCAWGDERIVTATEAELGPSALLPEALNGWSEAQLGDRARWNRRYGDFDWRPARRDRRKPIDWIAVENAHDGRQAHVPADFAFIGHRRDARAVSLGDSNGCAVGLTPEAAKLAALLELVERDATGRWWYGHGPCAPVDLASVGDEGDLLGWLTGRQRRSWLVDITTDLAIPAFAGVSAEADGRDVVLGFAARLDARDAALSALTEMLQMEFSLTTARALGAEAGYWNDWRSEVSMTTPPLAAVLNLSAEPLAPRNQEGQGLSAALEALARRGIDLYLADMTRPALGMPAFRAISATLCHFKPRFARARLQAIESTNGRPESQPLLVI